MRSEGFSFSSGVGGLEVGGALAQRCSSDGNRPQQFVMRSLSLTIERRSGDVTPAGVDFVANIARFCCVL